MQTGGLRDLSGRVQNRTLHMQCPALMHLPQDHSNPSAKMRSVAAAASMKP
jgi:hypothetical protein